MLEVLLHRPGCPAAPTGLEPEAISPEGHLSSNRPGHPETASVPHISCPPSPAWPSPTLGALAYQPRAGVWPALKSALHWGQAASSPPGPLASAPTLWAVPLGLQCASQFWVTLSWLEPPTAARTRPDSLFPEGRAVAGPLGSWTSPEPGVIPGWTFPDPHPRPSLASTRDTDLGTHSPPSATRCSPLCFVIITDGETEAGSHGQGGQSWRPGVRLHPDMLVPHLQSRIKHVGGGGLGMGGRGGPRFSLAVAREQHRPR